MAAWSGGSGRGLRARPQCSASMLLGKAWTWGWRSGRALPPFVPEGLFDEEDPGMAGEAAHQVLGALVDEVPPQVGEADDVRPAGRTGRFAGGCLAGLVDFMKGLHALSPPRPVRRPGSHPRIHCNR